MKLNNLSDDYEKLKQKLEKLQTQNLKMKNDLLNLNGNTQINIIDNNPINANDDLYEEVRKKKVIFDDESKSRALARIKKMKEKHKDEEDKLKVKKSAKISNIVKTLEESRRNHNNDNSEDNKEK